MSFDQSIAEHDGHLDGIATPQVRVLMEAIFRSLPQGRLNEGLARGKPVTSRQPCEKTEVRDAVVSL